MTKDQRVLLVMADALDGQQLLSSLGEEFEPEDIFSTQRLEEWAKDNGYISAPD